MILVIRIIGEPSLIAGRLVEETETHFVLSYPGVASTIPAGDGYRTVVAPVVPPVIKNHDSLMTRFEIRKDILLFYGELNEEWHGYYEEFEREVVAMMTGTKDRAKLH